MRRLAIALVLLAGCARCPCRPRYQAVFCRKVVSAPNACEAILVEEFCVHEVQR